MKCPKCGYVSFEYLVECKGCSNELKSHKDEYEIYMDQPQMLPILAYFNKQQDSQKAKAEPETNPLDDEFADTEAPSFDEETVTLEDLGASEEEKDVDLSATEVPDLDDIHLDQNIEDIDLSLPAEKTETEVVELNLDLGAEEEPEEISLDITEQPVAKRPVAEEEQVLTLDDITGEESEEEEITLDLNTEEEEVEEVQLGEVSLEEVKLPEAVQEEIETVDIDAIEEAEDLDLSLSLDEEETHPDKEPAQHRGGDEEVLTLDDLLTEDEEGGEISFDVEETDFAELEPKKAEETPAKASEVKPAEFDTGGLELSLETDEDAAKRAEELKKKNAPKSYDDLDIDIKLELE